MKVYINQKDNIYMPVKEKYLNDLYGYLHCEGLDMLQTERRKRVAELVERAVQHAREPQRLEVVEKKMTISEQKSRIAELSKIASTALMKNAEYENRKTKSQCSGKFCYIDKKSAETKKNYIMKTNSTQLYIYPCADHWHLTKKKPYYQ